MRPVRECLWCGSKDLTPVAIRKDKVEVLKCGNCRLFMNGKIPAKLEAAYDEDYFNTPASGHESGYETVHFLVSPAFLIWQNSLIEEVDEGHSKRRFLEVGAATGNLLEILAEYQPNLDLSGIDISGYAVNVAKARGFKVVHSIIENYTARPKMDIIFSAETMEHLAYLKPFLEGVKTNLSKGGAFLFYVPSISEAQAEKEKDKYIRFNVNMEHLLHFSPQFFEKQLPGFLGSKTFVKEFDGPYGPSIIGIVSDNSKTLQNFEKFFRSLQNNTVPRNASQIFLKNLAIIALKFGQFGLAGKAMKKMSKTYPDTIELVRALEHYHKGELEKAGLLFLDLAKAVPSSRIYSKLLLINERDLKALYMKQLDSRQQQLEAAEKKMEDLEAKIARIRRSKIVKGAILTNRVISRVSHTGGKKQGGSDGR